MKKFLTYFCLGVFLFAGIYAAVTMAAMPRTYDGADADASVYELQQKPEDYDVSAVSGTADAIVQEDLADSHAVNDVTSIVFDFRGYDTMGEAFILVAAVAGVAVILHNGKKKEEGEADGE